MSDEQDRYDANIASYVQAAQAEHEAMRKRAEDAESLHTALLDVVASLRENLVLLVESVDSLEQLDTLSAPAAEPEVMP